MRLSEVRECARKYYSLNLKDRRDLIKKVWLSDKKEGLELLAGMLGVTFQHLYNIGNIGNSKICRNKSRRKRSLGVKHQTRGDIFEVALEAAAGGYVHNSGGKKTTWKTGNGNTKSAASGQAWQALSGL